MDMKANLFREIFGSLPFIITIEIEILFINSTGLNTTHQQSWQKRYTTFACWRSKKIIQHKKKVRHKTNRSGTLLSPLQINKISQRVVFREAAKTEKLIPVDNLRKLELIIVPFFLVHWSDFWYCFTAGSTNITTSYRKRNSIQSKSNRLVSNRTDFNQIVMISFTD